MHTWIVLLRGINVGGHGKLPMKTLVELMEKAGCTDVRTYIQSGNAVCKSKIADAKTLAHRLAKAILASQGFEPKIMVLARDAFEAVIAGNPYPVDNHKALHVWFLAEEPAAETVKRLDAIKHPTEKYTIANGACYFYAPVAFGTSKLAAMFEKVAKVAATARNWRTIIEVQKLAASIDSATVRADVLATRRADRPARGARGMRTTATAGAATKRRRGTARASASVREARRR